MKKFLAVVLAAALVSVMACSAMAAGKVALRFGNGAALGAAGDLWGQAFCKHIKETSKGNIEVAYFPNSQLGVDSEMQTQMQNGDLDIVACQPGQTTTFVPAVAVYDLPLVFAKYNAKQIDKALNHSSFTDIMNKEYAKSNMVCLGILQGGTYRVMTSNKEIKALGDFKGIKIRTMNSPNHIAFWKAIGANPTPLAFTELYMSLQQGVVQAQENANDTNASSNFQEVQKYLVNVRQLLYMNQFLMNKKKFDSLAKADQDAIKKAVELATKDIAPNLVKIDSDARAKLVKGGMKNLEFKPAFYDELIKASQPVYKTIEGKIGAGVVNGLVNALKTGK